MYPGKKEYVSVRNDGKRDRNTGIIVKPHYTHLPYITWNRKIKCTNVVIISDYMKHDTSTVHAFISILNSYVKEELPGHNKLIYFSEGAASQYKKTQKR